MTAEKSARISQISRAGAEAARQENIIRRRETMNELFKRFGIKHSQIGNTVADVIEDWTTLILWLTEKGIKADRLTKDENTIALGIFCVVAEALTRHAAEDKAFYMMITANAANRAFFTGNPMRPMTAYEVAKRQYEAFSEDVACKDYVADIVGGVDSLFENMDEKVRTKIAIAISGLLKTARPVLGSFRS